MIAIDRNGRKYVAVKRYDPNGKFAERDTFRRYSIAKRYV